MTNPESGSTQNERATGESADEVRQPLLVAHGTGGRVELWENHVNLIKRGLVADLFSLVGLSLGMTNKSIMIDQISSITIVQPKILPGFIYFTYNGSPSSTGHWLRDALAENALLMNIFDNRRFIALKAQIDRQRQTTRSEVFGTSDLL